MSTHENYCSTGTRLPAKLLLLVFNKCSIWKILRTSSWYFTSCVHCSHIGSADVQYYIWVAWTQEICVTLFCEGSKFGLSWKAT